MHVNIDCNAQISVQMEKCSKCDAVPLVAAEVAAKMFVFKATSDCRVDIAQNEPDYSQTVIMYKI